MGLERPDSEFRRSKDLDMPPMTNPMDRRGPGSGSGTKQPPAGEKDLFLPGNESRKPVTDDLQPVPKSGSGDAGGREYRDENGGVRLPGPLLNLDAKITWRAVPERTRVRVRTGITTPVVARQSAPSDGNSEWQPAGSATKLVRK
jgi:hypothetical protein